MEVAPILVTGRDGLERVCSRLLAEPVVAVDTEFFWERTYYPVLGLVQVAVRDGTCWLIDPVELRDISPFGEVLASPSVVKILHDAVQDLTILSRATGASPKNIFDTRAAAGFAGLSSICSLKSLIEEVLGISLEKSETLSDWLERPLSGSQIRYAAEDVVYLAEVRERLMAAATPKALEWMAADFAALDDPGLYAERTCSDAYRRVKGYGRLPDSLKPVVRELAAWREETARILDIPRNYVAKDDSLIELSERPPARIADLVAVRGVRHYLPNDLAQAGVNRIRMARKLPPEEPFRGPIYDRKAVKNLARQVLDAIAERCKTFNIDPQLVGAMHDAESWICTPLEERGNLPLSAWRRTFFEEAPQILPEDIPLKA